LPSLLNAATQSVTIFSLGWPDRPHIEALPGATALPEEAPVVVVVVELLQPTTEAAARPAPAASKPRRETFEKYDIELS
jgi:hypothetical protein